MNDNSKYLIEKSNVLNSFETNEKTGRMSLVEFRFFCMYLSRLNPLDTDNRSVKITIKDFEKLFNCKVNITHLTENMFEMLKRIVIIRPNEEEIMYATLYSNFKLNTNNDYVTIECNNDILPYIFNIRNKFTRYMLENIINLNSVSKIRLYEILAQYKNLKEIEIEIKKLQSMIFSAEKEFRFFRSRVLEPAVKDINKYTDITVTYEKILERRKCVALKFYIESKEQPKVIECAETETVKEVETVPKWNGFTTDEENELYDYIRRELKNIYQSSAKMLHNRTETIYNNALTELKKHSNVKHHKAYIKRIIDTLIAEEQKKPKKEEKPRSYDINQFEKFAINYPELQKVENGEVSESHSEPVLESVKETKVICQEEIEKSVIEPVNAENEDEKMFDETPEGIALFSKALGIVNTSTEYNATISILDIVDKNWRRFEGVVKDILVDKLKEKENAPENIDVFLN